MWLGRLRLRSRFCPAAAGVGTPALQEAAAGASPGGPGSHKQGASLREPAEAGDSNGSHVARALTLIPEIIRSQTAMAARVKRV